MAFQTFDLGRVLQQGEAIKGMKRHGITDQLQQQYLTQNIKAGETAATNVAADREAKLGKDKATQVFTTMQYALQSPDPSAFVEQNAPELIQELSKNGVNWQQLDQPSRLRMLQGIQAKAGAEIGQGPAPRPVQMETIKNPDGSVFQKDPTTGKLTEVQGRKPRDPVPEKGPAAPAGYRYKADGSLEPIPGGPAAAGPKNANISEGERKAAALGTRLEGSLRELASIPLNEQKPGVMETVAGVAGETAANLARSSDRQRADAAQLDALDAALTLATGAAYTKEQLQNLRKSYFPQLGDSEANRKAKEKRFEMIVKTARIASGRAEPAINEAQSGATGGWSIEEVK